VLVLALTAVLVVVLAGVVALAQVAVVRHRAATAADLAALAAAGRVLEGATAACRAAADLATAQGAELTECRFSGSVVDVAVRVRLTDRGAAQARARAGPDPRSTTWAPRPVR
jgi:secretion/DNA translocation related TadE-like protein